MRLRARSSTSASTAAGSYASEPRRPKACAEVERLAHGEEREEFVALGDVAAKAAQGRGVDRGAIDTEDSRRGGARLETAGEDLEQHGLAVFAGPDDGDQEQLTGAGVADDVAENEAAPAASAHWRRGMCSRAAGGINEKT
ncbi:unnamed protein product [Triticum aestivum]|uniref:Uncharacterized protein n=2 Tax=Triticum TaxID=4564 RepID=A0A9R1S2R8_TRITD|nr:unnamed protein product [Triticum aestivum]VAH78082.1 unnamed protein product [Triticum turgidum subsp. durum]